MSGRTVKWIWEKVDVLPPHSASGFWAAVIDGYSTAMVQIVNGGGGEWAYTITFWGTVDGTNWDEITGVNKDTAALEGGCTDEGIWAFQVAGLEQLGFELTVYSGSPEVSITVGLSSAPPGEMWDTDVSDVRGAFELVDENGDAYGIKHVDNKPRVSAMSYLYDIAEGNVADHDAFRAFGYNPDVAAAMEDLWAVGGEYVFPTAGMGLELRSSSIQDSGPGGVNPAGTGIQTAMIHYLDDTYAEQTEAVILDGTTVVPTIATDILRVNAFHAVTTGTSKKAVGAIDLRHLADTPIYARISIGDNMALQAIWTVPLGKTAYLVHWHVGAASTTASRWARFLLKATSHNAVWQDGIFHTQDMVILLEGDSDHEFALPPKFAAKADIKIAAIGSGAGIVCTGGFEGWYES